MKLYLLRHADATMDASSDDERGITPKGESTINSLCELLKAKEFKELKAIYHSGLKRSQQTARLFKKGLELSGPVEAMDGLMPEDSPVRLANKFCDSEDDVLLVGHNPQFTFLAAYLLTGDQDIDCVDFKRSGLLCLERVDRAPGNRQAGVWLLRWYIIPRLT